MPDSFEEWVEMSINHGKLRTIEFTEPVVMKALEAAYNARVPEGYAVVKIDAGDLIDAANHERLFENLQHKKFPNQRSRPSRLRPIWNH